MSMLSTPAPRAVDSSNAVITLPDVPTSNSASFPPSLISTQAQNSTSSTQASAHITTDIESESADAAVPPAYGVVEQFGGLAEDETEEDVKADRIKLEAEHVGMDSERRTTQVSPLAYSSSLFASHTGPSVLTYILISIRVSYPWRW